MPNNYPDSICDYESDRFECDIWGGRVILTDKETGACGFVALRDTMTGKDITIKELKASIKSHGVERTLDVFSKLVWEWRQ